LKSRRFSDSVANIKTQSADWNIVRNNPNTSSTVADCLPFPYRALFLDSGLTSSWIDSYCL